MAGVVVDLQMKNEDKAKALEAAIGQIEKAFGKGSVMKLGQRESAVDIQAISTGSLGLDIGLGIGGFPKGRIIEIYGPESSGKTTLALHAVAEAQKEGGNCAFVDAEHALDPVYARKLGVNIDDLLISQPDAGEQALEIADTLVRSGAIDVLVIDSVAALVPRAELEGEMGDTHVGLQARLMSQALRKLTSSIARSNCLVIFINQIRLKIGVMFGNPETTTGGNALKFYASVRLDIRRIGAIKDRDEVIGNQTRVKVVKNKVAAPFRTIEFDIMYGEGISKMGELLDLGVAAGIVEKSGAWISYNGQRIGQGRENAKNFLRENTALAEEIEAAIRQNAGLVGDQMLDQSIAESPEAAVPDSPDEPPAPERGLGPRRDPDAPHFCRTPDPVRGPATVLPWRDFRVRRKGLDLALKATCKAGHPTDGARKKGACRQSSGHRDVRGSQAMSDTAGKSDEQRQRYPEGLSRLFRRERSRDRRFQPAGAAERSDADVHQCRHGAVQEPVHRSRDTRLQPRGDIAEMRSGRRQAQRPRERRLHRAPSHLFRDARQFLLRRLFQGTMPSSLPGTW